MPPLVDLVGQRFGRLVVIKLAATAAEAGVTMWLCRCDCGTEKVLRRNNLQAKNTFSCGCLLNSQGGKTRNHHLWMRWQSMRDRCEDENDKDYHRYGAKGVKVCERWKSFPLFLEDMESTFEEGLTLDRFPNGSGNYEPGNVRWASVTEQIRNRSNTVRVQTQFGLLPLAEAAERMNLPVDLLRDRHRRGWQGDKLFSPVQAQFRRASKSNAS